MAEAVAQLKGDFGRVDVVGSGDLVQTLLGNDLVDRLNLWVFPLLLGSGKRLFAEHWLPAMQVRGLRPSTLARYESHVRWAIIPALGGLPLQGLMPTHLNKLYGDLRAAGRAPKRSATSTGC